MIIFGGVVSDDNRSRLNTAEIIGLIIMAIGIGFFIKGGVQSCMNTSNLKTQQTRSDNLLLLDEANPLEPTSPATVKLDNLQIPLLSDVENPSEHPREFKEHINRPMRK